MVAGFDKYFQIAPCFRDEDSRADRSPGEFYQLDLEMSFIEQNDLFMLIESMFDHITKELSKKKIVALPFPQIAYRDSMDRFGTDKPDLRNPLEMIEVKDIFKTSTFKIFAENTKDGRTVKALVLKGRANESRMFYDKAEEKAKQLGLPGLAYIQFKDGGNKGPILKFMKEEELNLLKGKLKIETGDVVFFAAGIWERTCKIMGEMRSYFGKRLFEFDKNELAFCWIVDFPMYEYNEELKKIDFSHNPFSMPQGGLQALREKAPLDILAFQYDIVCNGIELSSGAIRNHKPEIMYKVFEIAGYSKADVDAKFGHMIRAFQHGAPPHGGIAPGFDRIVMIYRDEENLREVIPFPMNQKAQDLLMGAPSTVSEKQLTELHISINKIILNDISIDFPEREISILLGQSGSGKSVLLKLLIGLLKPDLGEIKIDGEQLSLLDARLDPIASDTIDELIRKVSLEYGITSIVVTHDLHTVFKIGSSIAFLNNAGFIFKGSTNEFEKCTEPTVRKFIEGR
ncbi:hypothetical protein CHS0354_023823 [Potamilus streckersoni]|uniref:Aminoacyl-transfer RNA synthetases class-II family profile domain-containing protein n=1 Tax=Potamilus streckersoni TaxID=2493646 RepID=A0AAE0VLH2_9BIVA|nr:hypothetical protein CHS0354_023823 [Potamilus streckersoni]